jgi:hypothetical protein
MIPGDGHVNPAKETKEQERTDARGELSHGARGAILIAGILAARKPPTARLLVPAA